MHISKSQNQGNGLSAKCACVTLFVGILKEVLNKKKLGFDKEILSRRVLPFVLPLSIEPGLNENQVRNTTLKDGLWRANLLCYL
jgi:hypothetical protein